MAQELTTITGTVSRVNEHGSRSTYDATPRSPTDTGSCRTASPFLHVPDVAMGRFHHGS